MKTVKEMKKLIGKAALPFKRFRKLVDKIPAPKTAVKSLMFVDDLVVEAFVGQSQMLVDLLGIEKPIATIKEEGILKGMRIQVLNWVDHEEAGYFSCLVLEDHKPYKKGDKIDLDKWQLSFNKEKTLE